MAKRRRAINGQGSVYQRASDGLWVASFTLSNGKRRVLYAATQSEALAKMQGERQKPNARLLSATEKTTVGEYLQAWLEGRVLNLKPATLRRYRELLTLHAIPRIGKVRMSRLTSAHLNGLYAECIARGLTGQTTRHLHAVLHAGLSRNAHTRDAMADAQRPRPENREMAALSQEECRRLLEVARGDRLEALFVVALASGAREGELLGLQWSAVDLEAGVITIRRSLSWATGKPTYGDTKTSKARSVALPPVAVDALRQHRVQQAEERLASVYWQDEDLVFSTAIGSPISPSNLRRRSFQPLLKMAELPLIRFHDLRHSSASALLAMGVPVNVVSQMLGHSRATVTLNVYGHVLAGQQEDAARKMQVALTG